MSLYDSDVNDNEFASCPDRALPRSLYHPALLPYFTVATLFPPPSPLAASWSLATSPAVLT
jgi:hypothetical protein